MLSAEEVAKIALLARIELTAEEVTKFQHDLSQVLDYVEELKQVNVDGLEEVSQVTGLENVMRLDAPHVPDYRDAILGQAPEIKNEYYQVKAIL
jgi:aspartyl-tRNA(Asn)/glutamyl-tRNA(Gln) amidotransferase subunit C